MDTPESARRQHAETFIGELTLVEQGLLDSIERSPMFLRGYLDLAFLYQVWGLTFDNKKIKSASETVALAMSWFPKNSLPYWSGVSLLLEQGRVDEAQQLAQTAVDLDPMVTSSMMRSLITVLFTKNSENIRRVAQQIVSTDPSMQSLVERYMGIDPDEKTIELLFRFYYDAAF